MTLLSGHATYQAPARAEATFETSWTLDLTLAGHVTFVHPEGDVDLHPTEVLLVRPNRHKGWFVPAAPVGEGRKINRWEVIWFIFQVKEPMLAWMQYEDTRPGYIRLRLRSRETVQQVVSALKEAHRLATSHHPGREDLALHAIEQALIWCHYDQKGDLRRLDRRVEEALRFLHGNLHRSIRIADVARACRASRARLLAVFKREVGVPLMTYLEQERLRRSQRLLTHGWPSIKQVAAEVGYSDPRYFSKRFKRAVGVSPAVWRHRQAALSTG
jgi:AraC family transcriptional regulator of arabinose operon